MRVTLLAFKQFNPMNASVYCRRKKPGLDILTIQTGNIDNRYLFGTFRLAFPLVGTVSKTELIHDFQHGLNPLGCLGSTLWQKCQGT